MRIQSLVYSNTTNTYLASHGALAQRICAPFLAGAGAGRLWKGAHDTRSPLMTTTSGRSLWKGAISFGLVHIPVALHAATAEGGLNFDWLDKRTMDPVGYKRINKKTG